MKTRRSVLARRVSVSGERADVRLRPGPKADEHCRGVAERMKTVRVGYEG